MDVDTGTDDAVCIAAATLCSDAIDLVGIGTVCGNVEIDKTSRNTLDLVDFLGCDVPVHVGAARPLARPLCTAVSHGATGLGDVILPAARRSHAPGSVTEMIASAARRHPGALEILAVGPAHQHRRRTDGASRTPLDAEAHHHHGPARCAAAT